jgi:hypothetical protein
MTRYCSLSGRQQAEVVQAAEEAVDQHDRLAFALLLEVQ